MTMCEHDIALKVVERAVLDWRLLISAKAWEAQEYIQQRNTSAIPSADCNFNELRAFFKGGTCDEYLHLAKSDLTGQAILEQLEKELEEAKEKRKIIFSKFH